MFRLMPVLPALSFIGFVLADGTAGVTISDKWSPDFVHYVLASVVAILATIMAKMAVYIRDLLTQLNNAKDSLRDKATQYAEERRVAEMKAADERRGAEVGMLQQILPLTAQITETIDALLPHINTVAGSCSHPQCPSKASPRGGS